MDIKLNERVKVIAVDRKGKIVREDSGIGIVKSIRRKYFSVILQKNKRAIRFDMDGNGQYCIYKTTIEKLNHHD